MKCINEGMSQTKRKTETKTVLATPPKFKELTPESYDELIRDLHKQIYEAHYKIDYWRMKHFGHSSERLAAILGQDPTPCSIEEKNLHQIATLIDEDK